MSNPDDGAAFQAELYKQIDPEPAMSIISVTHRPNCAIKDVSILVNHLPINLFRRNEIDKDIMTFASSAGILKRYDILINFIPSKQIYG